MAVRRKTKDVPIMLCVVLLASLFHISGSVWWVGFKLVYPFPSLGPNIICVSIILFAFQPQLSSKANLVIFKRAEHSVKTVRTLHFERQRHFQRNCGCNIQNVPLSIHSDNIKKFQFSRSTYKLRLTSYLPETVTELIHPFFKTCGLQGHFFIVIIVL